eukprot:2695635-Amphidinium_carterae.3
MPPSWTSETRQFTRQYYKWLEDIDRYEAENGHGSITDHVKIATIVNNQGQHCREPDDENQSDNNIQSHLHRQCQYSKMHSFRQLLTMT